jgi:hypothetical protein
MSKRRKMHSNNEVLYSPGIALAAWGVLPDHLWLDAVMSDELGTERVLNYFLLL